MPLLCPIFCFGVEPIGTGKHYNQIFRFMKMSKLKGHIPNLGTESSIKMINWLRVAKYLSSELKIFL